MDLQARYNEIASIVARHTISLSPGTFHRLVHSSSLDQRGPGHSSSGLAALANILQAKQSRNNRRLNQEALNSNESSNSSVSEDDYDFDYNEIDGSEHARPIEPVLTTANVGPAIGTSLNQPFQIRSSVHLEHRLGPMTSYNQQPNIDNRIASCAVCSIL